MLRRNLQTERCLSLTSLESKKVFVQAGSGGVGTFAIQLLKYWGAQVATTCSQQNHSLVKELGAEISKSIKE